MATLSKKIRLYDPAIMAQVNPETLKLWSKYKIDMSLRELSPTSIAGYESDLRQWWIYIYKFQDNKSVLEIDEDDVTEFLYFCKSEGNNSRRMKRRMSSIAAFYQFLRKKRLIAYSPMEFIDRPQKDTDVITQTFLTIDQVNLMKEKLSELVQTSNTVFQKHIALQLQCYAMFSLSTMARVTAISNITWSQLDFDERIATDVLEKEGKIVTLYYSSEVRDLLIGLQQYRIDNNISDSGFLFVNNNGLECEKISVGSLTAWCKKIGALIDVPTLHPHDFRHSGSQLMKLNGANVEDIAELLHHESTDTTIKHYLRVDAKKVKENRDKYGV